MLNIKNNLSEQDSLKFSEAKTTALSKKEKNKFFAKKSILVERIEGQRTERLLKKCFDAIKICNIQYRYEETNLERDARDLVL